MIKKLKLFVMLLLPLLVATGCGNANTNEEESSQQEEDTFSVAMVTDAGGIDDKSFNQSSWEGLQRFGQEQGLTEGEGYKYLESGSDAEYKPNLNSLIRDKFDLIYGIGFLMAEDVKDIAIQRPNTNLAIVDMVITDEEGNTIPNIANITFKEEEGSFLVGLIAGLQTKTDKIGFVGGVEYDLIKKFENGFKAGVKAVNPQAEIMVQYAGSFSDAAKGQSIASTMYGTGADIIYHASGGTGMGVFTEAKNRKKNGENVWVIGVDRDQHEEGMPENVTLTSMIKRVDQAVYDVSQQTLDGNFPGGEILSFGLVEDGVGISETKENVSEESLQVVEEYKEKIKNGEISIPKTDEEFMASEFNK